MAFRAFYALPVDKITTSTGQATNAVHGFVSMLLRLISTEEPSHIAVAFDVGHETFRTRAYADYKGTREKTPPEFSPQIPLIAQVLDALRITHVQVPDFEADDILATLATRAEDAKFDEVLICSGDRDTLQLVTDTTTVLYPTKGVSTLTRFTPQAVEEKYGVRPERYPEIAALVGETSDNLPGVPGVGPKTAAKWINTYDGLQNVLEQREDIKGKAGQSLRDHVDLVIRNRELNHLLRDMELPVDLPDLARQPAAASEVHQIFDTLESRDLRDRVFAVIDCDESAPEVPAPEPIEVTQWSKDGQLREFLAGIDNAPLAVRLAEGTRLALASRTHSLVIDLTELAGEDERLLAEYLAGPAPKVVHAGKELRHQLNERGLVLAAIVFDTDIAAYLLHPDVRRRDLNDLVRTHLNRELAVREDAGQLMLDLDHEEAVRVVGEEAGALAELAVQLQGALGEHGAEQLMTAMELPVQDILYRMELAGIAIDTGYLRDLHAELASDVDAAAADAYAAIGRTINLSSPKQLQEVLFDDLDMPKTRRTKTGWTTNSEALNDLFARTQHPFLAALLAHRDRIKLKQIVESLHSSVGDDQRIHTTFQQTVAATGRLSSTDPNLQNIPARSAVGIRIREAFIAGEEAECLLTADYSQIEMRIMAHLSEDAGLIDAFRKGEDLHSYVGARVFDVGMDEVNSQMRSQVKAMSYGLAYGLSAYGLSRQLGIEVGEASRLMDDYFARFGGVRDYLAAVVEQARKTGYTETMFGRRRYLPDLMSDNRQRREMAERAALNAPIQGSAADIIKRAMIAVDTALADAGLASRVLLQVHDELIVEVAAGESGAVEALVRDKMASAADLRVPLDVSVGIGRSWREAAH